MSAPEDELSAALTRLALAGDGLLLGVSMTVLAIRTWIKYWSHSKALKDIKGTPLTRIADLRTLVKDTDVEPTENYSNSEKNSPPVYNAEIFATQSTVRMPIRVWTGESSPAQAPEAKLQRLVVVRGRVQTKASVESGDSIRDTDALVPVNVSEQAVFVERTQTCLYNKWRGMFRLGFDNINILGWGSLKDQVSLSKRKVPFVLAENEVRRFLRPRESAVYVHVNLDDSQHPMPLVTVHHQLHPVPASSYTLFQAMFGRRYPVGLLDEEKILPLGAEITAVGELYSAPDGTPVIKSSKRLPIFLTEFTREQLLVELANGTRVLLWAGLAVSTVAVGVLGYSIVKNWTKWKQRQQQRRGQTDETRQDTIVDDEVENLDDVPDGELCVVCLMRRRRAAFIYCGHRVCCVGCAQRVEHGVNPRCPVCRQPVTGIVRVYDS